ncbi:uncharacterized protein [Haliotis asinina]|uniref:uncharacterized protein n=1 Tax=Haliotis asinina TaxID=109174 RepID=UPI0035321F2D
MSVCSLEFSFPRSFLVKIYQKRFSAPFVEYSASYLSANFDLKRCAVRTINDDRLAKQCQLRTEHYDPLAQSASSSEGKIVVELRKLAVDVSKSAIRISLFDIIDQPFRAEQSDTDNENTATIDRINFTLPHSYVLKSVKNTAGSSFHLEAWYLGQGGVVLPCMLNTTCECLDDGGGEQLTFVFDGLILNTQTRPLTMKFLSASINSKDYSSEKASKSSQGAELAKIPSNSETVTTQREQALDSLQSSETGSAQEGESQVTPTLCPLIASSMTPSDEAAPVIDPLLQVSACPNTSTVGSNDSNSHSPKESDPTCDPSYSSLVHIEEIIANDFSTSKTSDTDSESVEKIEIMQEKPGTISESVKENIPASISESQKNGKTSDQNTNDSGLQGSKDGDAVIDVDHDASCSVEKTTDKGENGDCLAKGHSMELVDPVSGIMTIMRVSDDEDEEEVEIVGVEDSVKSKEGQKPNKTPKKVAEDNSDLHKIVASIVESLNVDNAQKGSSSVSASNDSLMTMDSRLKSPEECQSTADKLIGLPPVRLDMLPGVIGSVLGPSATPGQVCLPLSANSKQDPLNKGKSSHVGEFDPEWADHFPWLMYDRNQHIMYCQVCIYSKKSNIFTAGSHFFMRDPLITHTKSQQHIDALRIVQETASAGQSPQWLEMVHRCQEQIQSIMGLQNVFDYAWLIDFPWLKYDEVDHKVFCKICQKHKRKTLFAQGVTLFSRRRIREHQKNKCHVDALLLENATLESNGEIKSKTVMRLDANSELIFSMETMDTEKEPLHWNRIVPPEEDNKTPQKEPDMDIISIKSEDSFHSPKLVASGPYKVSPALSPVVILTDVRKSPPDTPLSDGRRTSLSRHGSSQSQSSKTRSKQPRDVSKKCVTTGDSGSEKSLSSKRNRRPVTPCSPASSLGSPPVDVDADINTLLPLVVMDNVDTLPKSVAKRLSFNNLSDSSLANGLSSSDSSRQKRSAVNGEKKLKEDPDKILINYLSCTADTPKKKWLENVDASLWKPVVVLDDISEDLSILNAPSVRRRHCSQTKEKTIGKSKKTFKRLVSTDTESVASKKSKQEDHDLDDDTPFSVRIEASKANKSKTTRTSDLVDVGDSEIVGFSEIKSNTSKNGFSEIKSNTGKKLMNAAETSVDVFLETGRCRSSRKKGAMSPRSDTESVEPPQLTFRKDSKSPQVDTETAKPSQVTFKKDSKSPQMDTETAKPPQVTFENSYDMMEILDGLDLTDMMMCHVVLKRIAV